MAASKINVLIVDDSMTFRRAVELALKDENNINIVGSVRNGLKAIEFIKDSPVKPDILTLDIEMPDLNGLETLDRLSQMLKRGEISAMPGVVILSALSKKGADVTVKALESGAFDFVTKPVSGDEAGSIEILRRQLTTKINVWDTGRKKYSGASSVKQMDRVPAVPVRRSSRIDSIVIGVSTGGPRALNEMVPVLCEKVDLPVLVVQHMPPTFTKSLAEQLQMKCRDRYSITEGSDGDIVANRKMFIAPGVKHMTIRKLGSSISVATNDQPPENGCKPSVDVLFRSVASCYGGNVLALILTGMGSDGTKGLAALKRAGAYVIAQDEQSSVVWGMPGSAVSSGVVDQVLPLMDIPDAVSKIIYGI